MTEKNNILLNATIIAMCGVAMVGCGEVTQDEKKDIIMLVELEAKRKRAPVSLLRAALVANDREGIKDYSTPASKQEREYVTNLMLEGKIDSKSFQNYTKLIESNSDLHGVINYVFNAQKDIKYLRMKGIHIKEENINEVIKIVYDEFKTRTEPTKGKISVIHPNTHIAKGLADFLNNRAMV